MAWSDDAADAVATAFATFAVQATDPLAPTYTAPAGSPMPCAVIAKSKDRMVSFGEGRPFAEGTVIEVQASDVALPVKGGIFSIGNSTFTIIADPEQLDDLRLVWTCRVK
jgi:hypothetical protein